MRPAEAPGGCPEAAPGPGRFFRPGTLGSRGRPANKRALLVKIWRAGGAADGYSAILNPPKNIMATLTERVPANVAGAYYVDSTCIDCDQCRVTASEFFGRTED